MLVLGQSHRVLQYSRVRQWGAMGRKSYRIVRLSAPAKFRILYSKISHEINKQWKSSYKNPDAVWIYALNIIRIQILKGKPRKTIVAGCEDWTVHHTNFQICMGDSARMRARC
jgi:hypothetical protein